MNADWYVINVNCGETLDILAFARILSRWLGGNTLWFQLSGWHPASHVAFETHPLGPCNFLLHSCLNCLVHDALPVECSLKSSYRLSIYTHWNFRLFKTHFFFLIPVWFSVVAVANYYKINTLKQHNYSLLVLDIRPKLVSLGPNQGIIGGGGSGSSEDNPSLVFPRF